MKNGQRLGGEKRGGDSVRGGEMKEIIMKGEIKV